MYSFSPRPMLRAQSPPDPAHRDAETLVQDALTPIQIQARQDQLKPQGELSFESNCIVRDFTFAFCCICVWPAGN